MRRSGLFFFKPLCLVLGVALLPALFPGQANGARTVLARAPTRIYPPNTNQQVLKVLQRKCNVCHRKQNPRRVFTLDNMERLAPKIYRQVIVKKRMPKGNAQKLTAQEYTMLKNWLSAQLQN